ncbi:hypothetical protein Patl1_05973 [Pistacia atlantica]|uniref:Uncharacterized protein n=1 Tax=Pistacia atlantica TaxID=434234 RepID=A0ACC1BTD0_9ROSI|nr:hypothetical protein Patl1_05973 [Pistacia atlantica]
MLPRCGVKDVVNTTTTNSGSLEFHRGDHGKARLFDSKSLLANAAAPTGGILAVHEIGHVIGLDHSFVIESAGSTSGVMNAGHSNNAVPQPPPQAYFAANCGFPPSLQYTNAYTRSFGPVFYPTGTNGSFSGGVSSSGQVPIVFGSSPMQYDQSWHVKSGATSHMIPYPNNLLVKTEFQGSNQLQVGNGQSVPIVQTDMLSHFTKNANNSSSLN